jgi:hypothetical protein
LLLRTRNMDSQQAEVDALASGAVCHGGSKNEERRERGDGGLLQRAERGKYRKEGGVGENEGWSGRREHEREQSGKVQLGLVDWLDWWRAEKQRLGAAATVEQVQDRPDRPAA